MKELFLKEKIPKDPTKSIAKIRQMKVKNNTVLDNLKEILLRRKKFIYTAGDMFNYMLRTCCF